MPPGAASAGEGVMKRIVVLAVVAASQFASASQLRSAAEIRQILADRLEGFEQHVGIVVGVIGPDGWKIFLAGSMAMNDPQPVDGDTLFEAGSDALVTFDFDKDAPARASQLTFSWGFFDPRRAKRVE